MRQSGSADHGQPPRGGQIDLIPGALAVDPWPDRVAEDPAGEITGGPGDRRLPVVYWMTSRKGAAIADQMAEQGELIVGHRRPPGPATSEAGRCAPSASSSRCFQPSKARNGGCPSPGSSGQAPWSSAGPASTRSRTLVTRRRSSPGRGVHRDYVESRLAYELADGAVLAALGQVHAGVTGQAPAFAKVRQHRLGWVADSTARESCEIAITGTSSSRARILRPRLICPICSTRLSARPSGRISWR